MSINAVIPTSCRILMPIENIGKLKLTHGTARRPPSQASMARIILSKWRSGWSTLSLTSRKWWTLQCRQFIGNGRCTVEWHFRFFENHPETSRPHPTGTNASAKCRRNAQIKKLLRGENQLSGPLHMTREAGNRGNNDKGGYLTTSSYNTHRRAILFRFP